MPDFLVQSYLADAEQAVAAVSRARCLRSPRLLRAIIVPHDQLVLLLWRADDPEAVSTATRVVGLPSDRISPAQEVDGTESPDHAQAIVGPGGV
jgi:hypothetical protein